MKRKYDPDGWADRQRYRRKPKEIAAFNAWLAEREAGFAAAAKVLKIQHMMAMNVGADKVPEPSSVWNGTKIRLKIAILMPDGQAAVWTPERGYEMVAVADHPDVYNALPVRVMVSGSVGQQLADITRRAFVPSLFVEIYQSSPLLALLHKTNPSP